MKHTRDLPTPSAARRLAPVSPVSPLSRLSAFALPALAVLTAVTPGCGRVKKQEVGSLAAAVERFEGAKSEERVNTAPAVAAVNCTDPEVKAACEVCARGATETARALGLKVEVEQGIADLKAGRITRGDAQDRGLGDKLDEAMSLVGKAKESMGDCDGRLQALKKAVGL